VALTLYYGAMQIERITTVSDAAPQVYIGIAQGNIDQSRKWDPAFQAKTIGIYESQTRKLAERGARLVVWPETAVPLFFQSERKWRRRILELARETKTEILFGAPAFERRRQKPDLYNRAYLVGTDLQVRGHYDKMHLVPFGEYVPFQKLLFFVKRMVETVGDLTPGEEARILPSADGAAIGVSICFESIFPDISRALTQNGADLLANLTNDAWYGDTAGPYQHLSLLTLRAVDNRRWIVRAANNGVSAVVDPVGRVVSRIPLMDRGILVDTVARIRLDSFYTAHGDWFAWACSLWGGGLFVFCLLLSLGRRRRTHAGS
jgi:apolipoprotein N-acyltransferase